MMVRRRLCSITDVAPVAERAFSSTARTPWCNAPSTQRRPNLQLVKVGRRQGSTTDVAHLGWARLLIDRMDTQVWCSAPSKTPEPALGSTKAFSQDDEVPLGKPTATTCFGCS